MAFRKWAAPKIFDGEKILTGHVLIAGEDGVIENVVPLAEAGDGVEPLNGILTPGFINCHCHLELSHLKGLIPEKTGLVDFVFKVITERHHPEEEILQAISDAEHEMQRNGIIAVGDICNNTLTLAQKQKGNLRYYNFIEASGWLPSVSPLRFERALNLYQKFLTTNHKPRTANCSIVPHAPYSVSENLWQAIRPHFENKVVCIHNQETTFEDEFFLEGTGGLTRLYELMQMDNTHHQPTKQTSLQSYFEKLMNAANIILVHNTFTKQQDTDFVKQQTTNDKPQTFFCLCPNANLYIENALPPVELFRQNGCTIVLGTDSLASNWSLNILDEIKTIRHYFPIVPLEEILQWATLNGAKALQTENELGSFEEGRKPGIILLNEDSLSVQKILASA